MQGYDSNGVSGYLVKTIEAYCDGQPNCMDEVIENLIKDRTRGAFSGIAILSRLCSILQLALRKCTRTKMILVSTQFVQLNNCAKFKDSNNFIVSFTEAMKRAKLL